MSDTNNREYYRVRAEHARRLADAAVSESIRAIHLEMATRYEALAEPEPPRRSPLRLATA